MRIAEIALAPGQAGYYDDLSNTRLTAVNPNKIILAGTNVSNLLTAVKEKKIILLWGSLYTHQITQMATQSTRVAFVVPEAETSAPSGEENDDPEEKDETEDSEQQSDKTEPEQSEPEIATMSVEPEATTIKTAAKRSRSKAAAKKTVTEESASTEEKPAVEE